MTGTLGLSETILLARRMNILGLQGRATKTLIIVPLEAAANFFALKSSTRLVVCSHVRCSDATRIPALPKVKDYASISHQKVFWKNQTFPNLSRNGKLVMAIVTVGAIKTIMDIKTNRFFSGIERGSNTRKLLQGSLFNFSH